ncbi:hypothetical protein OCH7691_03008 [Oceanibacterium hippocampi]|uniref:Uncharacterized protein n=1 Tax=Oceanibacterium hippocampi TaxID=745714 RepID=A0A1Y5TQ85_9PROT|nr:hypothetical protein OCH7691_03008 [Oceanibacterium hippocampi]
MCRVSFELTNPETRKLENPPGGGSQPVFAIENGSVEWTGLEERQRGMSAVLGRKQ